MKIREIGGDHSVAAGTGTEARDEIAMISLVTSGRVDALLSPSCVGVYGQTCAHDMA